jgi:hypothetical protein
MPNSLSSNAGKDRFTTGLLRTTSLIELVAEFLSLSFEAVHQTSHFNISVSSVDLDILTLREVCLSSFNLGVNYDD